MSTLTLGWRLSQEPVSVLGILTGVSVISSNACLVCYTWYFTLLWQLCSMLEKIKIPDDINYEELNEAGEWWTTYLIDWMFTIKLLDQNWGIIIKIEGGMDIDLMIRMPTSHMQRLALNTHHWFLTPILS